MHFKVHQIWIGATMPEREAAWVESVRRHAIAAGWQHKLWGWDELMEAYGGEPVAALFRRLMADFPMPTTYTLASDYYRLRVLADGGGVYLDTDFAATGWPELPAEVDIYLLSEFFARQSACNGFFYCRRPEVMRKSAMMVANRLLTLLPPDAADLPIRYVDMVRRDGKRGGLPNCGIGPGFMRKVVIPTWCKHGVTMRFIPEQMVGHRQWQETSLLTHWGTAHWHEGTRSENDPFWQGVAARAAELTAKNRHEEQRRALTALPRHLQPYGSIIKPVFVRKKAISEPKKTILPLQSAEKLQFIIPKDVQRIVILSNVTTGFSIDMVPVQAGDLCIHCNHSRHRVPAMAIQGTHHWLFVRHGKGRDPRGWHWYHDGSFDGFEKVFFVNDASMVKPFNWWRDFRKISPKSPTTGFIAANAMKECYPNMPIVLAGFDPANRHGTPQWDGHAWKVEATWYTERGFTLYKPRPKLRILLIIGSCLDYSMRSVRIKTAREVYEQRRACRISWLNKLLPSNVRAIMVVGRGKPIHEPMVQQLDVEDDFWHLPAKMRAAFKYALDNEDFDWLVKCDDDSFIHLERLVQYIATLPPGSRDIYGAAAGKGDGVCGGGGYILHRDMVATIAADDKFPDRGREDREVGNAVLRAGGKIVIVPQMNSTRTPSPAKDNDIISCHHLSPRMMRKIHTDCFLL